jgi:hypothetical protein
MTSKHHLTRVYRFATHHIHNGAYVVPGRRRLMSARDARSGRHAVV